jgi:hypothetical protein
MVGTYGWKITVFYIKLKKYINPRKSHVQEFEWDIVDNFRRYMHRINLPSKGNNSQGL